jgi:hypothetical protein
MAIFKFFGLQTTETNRIRPSLLTDFETGSLKITKSEGRSIKRFEA